MLTSKHFMILDEPFSGLDVGNIEKVKLSFDKISANELNTIIFSTIFVLQLNYRIVSIF
jgi:ABC-type uncharacterized transport system ATPase subunit